MKTTSNVIVHTAIAKSKVVQFSDLERGVFFTRNYDSGLTGERLYVVAVPYVKSTTLHSESTPPYIAQPAQGVALCIGHNGGSYLTASDQSFPKGVEVVDVKIVVNP